MQINQQMAAVHQEDEAAHKVLELPIRPAAAASGGGEDWLKKMEIGDVFLAKRLAMPSDWWTEWVDEFTIHNMTDTHCLMTRRGYHAEPIVTAWANIRLFSKAYTLAEMLKRL